MDGESLDDWVEMTRLEGGTVLGVCQTNDDAEFNSPIKPGQNAIVTFTVDDIESAKKSSKIAELWSVLLLKFRVT